MHLGLQGAYRNFSGTCGWSPGLAMNARGQVVGASTVASGDTHAVLWTNRDDEDDEDDED